MDPRPVALNEHLPEQIYACQLLCGCIAPGSSTSGRSGLGFRVTSFGALVAGADMRNGKHGRLAKGPELSPKKRGRKLGRQG